MHKYETFPKSNHLDVNHLNHPIKYNRALECDGSWELLALLCNKARKVSQETALVMLLCHLLRTVFNKALGMLATRFVSQPLPSEEARMTFP